jgi:putative intracellular protease/amidase
MTVITHYTVRYKEHEKVMKVFIYVLDTLADWEISYLTAELTSKRYFKDKNADCRVVKVGKSTKGAITTMGGIVIKPDISISELSLNQGDILVLPGAETWFDTEQDEILGFVKDHVIRKNTVAAICGATFGLARFGLLNDARHTSNNKYYLTEYVPGYTGGDKYVEEPAITDQKLITASGLAPVEFTYEVIKSLGVWNDETPEAWKDLYTVRNEEAYYRLMNSLK